jgi:periplasmic divalent cation tolerance protein
MDIIAIYVTHANQQNADKINDHLFRKKLISSVNSFPVQTTFVSNGKLEKTEEIVTIYKTKPQNREPIKEAIKEVHPYDLPCIMKMDCIVNHGHRNQIIESVV